jgi:hypothetical protein
LRAGECIDSQSLQGSENVRDAQNFEILN